MTLKQSNKHISLIAALCLAGTAALAQQPGPAGGMQPSSSQQLPTPGQPGPNGNTPGTDLRANQAYTPSLADQAFVKDTLKDDQAQIQLSQLAQQKSTSDDVKQFGQHMIEVQTQLDKQLQPFAKQLYISEPAKPSKQEKQEMARLQALSGPDFDTAYLQAMSKEQRHNLKEFKQEAEGTQDPMIQNAARADAPVLSQNFQVLQKLAATHNVTLESK